MAVREIGCRGRRHTKISFLVMMLTRPGPTVVLSLLASLQAMRCRDGFVLGEARLSERRPVKGQPWGWGIHRETHPSGRALMYRILSFCAMGNTRQAPSPSPPICGNPLGRLCDSNGQPYELLPLPMLVA